MYLNGHHITKFAKKRWRLTNDILAKDYLFCSKFSLSRKEPPKVEANHYYKSLFDVKYPSSAAAAFGENEKDLLLALRDYLVKNELNTEANIISRKIKEGSAYKEIFLEVLRRAGTQPDKNEALEESQINGALGKEKIEEKKSLLDEFDSAISKYEFMEFIKSEPLQEFIVRPELDADKLESQYAEHEDGIRNTLRDFTKSISGDNSDYRFGDSQDENFSYTHKFLTPTLLDMSQRLVGALTEKLLPAIKISGHPVYGTIVDFKDKLNSYNEFLENHLKDEGDHFIYDIKSVVKNEEALKVQGAKEVMAVCIDLIEEHEDTDGKRISLEYIKNTKFDKESSLKGFHSKTRRDRDAICSLYEKILKKLFRSGV